MRRQGHPASPQHRSVLTAGGGGWSLVARGESPAHRPLTADVTGGRLAHRQRLRYISLPPPFEPPPMRTAALGTPQRSTAMIRPEAPSTRAVTNPINRQVIRLIAFSRSTRGASSLASTNDSVTLVNPTPSLSCVQPKLHPVMWLYQRPVTMSTPQYRYPARILHISGTPRPGLSVRCRGSGRAGPRLVRLLTGGRQDPTLELRTAADRC